ncbi:PD-(D/E)XK motif protein [Amycolatopsis keratiniphila]|uniref:PD-(D/E)XK motif protein n=1 Tax=Amycolatopsis keratiniphila TaxID=129921 RepID=UPI0033F574B9
MASSLREVLNEHWQRLESTVPSSTSHLRTSELPSVSELGRLLAAVDHDGLRHLLVPLAARQRVRRGSTGAVLNLRERALEDDDTYGRYADLCCSRLDLNDVFTGLCGDVLTVVEDNPSRPLKALYLVVDRWRALFQSTGPTLNSEQLAGLFGELTVLRRLLELNPAATEHWTGPSGHRHDFVFAPSAIEVKASTATEGRRVRIHGADQLECPLDGRLDLVWIRLERVPDGGLGLVELVEHLRRLSDDENGFLLKLAQIGYRPADIDLYREVRFVVREELWFEVGRDFPRLTPTDLPVDIVDVQYSIDIASEPPHPIKEADLDHHLNEITQEVR